MMRILETKPYNHGIKSAWHENRMLCSSTPNKSGQNRRQRILAQADRAFDRTNPNYLASPSTLSFHEKSTKAASHSVVGLIKGSRRKRKNGKKKRERTGTAKQKKRGMKGPSVFCVQGSTFRSPYWRLRKACEKFGDCGERVSSESSVFDSRQNILFCQASLFKSTLFLRLVSARSKKCLISPPNGQLQIFEFETQTARCARWGCTPLPMQFVRAQDFTARFSLVSNRLDWTD